MRKKNYSNRKITVEVPEVLYEHLKAAQQYFAMKNGKLERLGDLLLAMLPKQQEVNND